jgi:hypothetical protein
MPDEKTYGFNKDDANSLVQGISNGEDWFPEIKPRGLRTGGSSHTIWFTIDDVLCPGIDYVDETTLIVTAEWYTGGCSKTPPGATYEGTYEVYDVCSYLNGLTPTDLIGTKGRATYHYPLTGYCEPRWIIDDLCASAECA